MHRVAVLGYLPKLKRSMGQAFRGHILHDFLIKYSVFNTLSMDKVPMSQHFSFSRYQLKSVVKFLFRQ